MSGEIAKQVNDLDSFGLPGRKMATSLDISDKSKRLLILKCLQDCDSRITEHVGEPIVVTDYFIHDVQLTSKEDGELIICPRLVLIDKDGFTHECVSATILSSMQSIAFVNGKPPWPDGVTLVPRMKRKGERNIYFLEMK